MRNSIFILLLCCFIVACNDKATQVADDSETIRTDTVLTDETHDELLEQVQVTVDAQVQDTDVVAQAFQNRSHSYGYGVTELDFGMIETFLVPNKDETIRVRIDSEPEDSIDRYTTAAIALITRNEPLSVDTIRITRSDLNAIIDAPDIKKLEICSIHFKECRADTIVFSLALTIPDTDDGYSIECHHYDKKNHFEWDVIDVSEGNY